MASRGAAPAPAAIGAAADSRASTLHPAVWIAGWGVGAILIQKLGLRGLAVLSAPILILVGRFAAREALRLVWRARWLFIVVAVLFVLATPGERLAGLAGAAGLTVDGLAAAAAHVLRLLLLLATLAWLLRGLRHHGLVAGLHLLLRPLGRLRDRIVVRLLLAMEYAADERLARNWRAWLGADGAETAELVSLVAPELRATDRALLAVCGVAALMVLLT